MKQETTLTQYLAKKSAGAQVQNSILLFARGPTFLSALSRQRFAYLFAAFVAAKKMNHVFSTSTRFENGVLYLVQEIVGGSRFQTSVIYICRPLGFLKRWDHVWLAPTTLCKQQIGKNKLHITPLCTWKLMETI